MKGLRSGKLTRGDTGFLLAKAMQRWNDQLYKGFRKYGYSHVRPSYGSVLVPLFEEDGLRIGELGRRSKLSKQTMTTMIRLVERDGLVSRKQDSSDSRATRVFLTEQAKKFRPVASAVVSDLEEKARTGFSAKEFKTVRRWLQSFATAQ